jgi:hypothetical protein
MAAKQGDGVEKRKHLTATSAQRKEKSQKTSKTCSKVNDVITNTTITEKKNSVFCSLAIICLGRTRFNISNIRSEVYRRYSTRDLSYGILYTWGLFMPAMRIVKMGNQSAVAMFDVCRLFLYNFENLPVLCFLASRNLVAHQVFVTCYLCLA